MSAPAVTRRVAETDLLEHHPGVQWTYGQVVTIRAGAGGEVGPLTGRVREIKRCRGKFAAGGPGALGVRSKPIDCFILLLSRDGR